MDFGILPTSAHIVKELFSASLPLGVIRPLIQQTRGLDFDDFDTSFRRHSPVLERAPKSESARIVFVIPRDRYCSRRLSKPLFLFCCYVAAAMLKLKFEGFMKAPTFLSLQSATSKTDNSIIHKGLLNGSCWLNFPLPISGCGNWNPTNHGHGTNTEFEPLKRRSPRCKLFLAH